MVANIPGPESYYQIAFLEYVIHSKSGSVFYLGLLDLTSNLSKKIDLVPHYTHAKFM